MSDIFISYDSSDRDRAKTLAEALESKGWSVWWDRNIPPGKTFDQVIEEALNETKCVIVLWSQESINSNWVKEEASEGLRRNILVPALIDTVNIPLGFKRLQAANLVDWNGTSQHTEFDEMVAAIEGIVGKSEIVEPEKISEPEREFEPKISQKIQDIPTESLPSKSEQKRKVGKINAILTRKAVIFPLFVILLMAILAQNFNLIKKFFLTENSENQVPALSYQATIELRWQDPRSQSKGVIFYAEPGQKVRLYVNLTHRFDGLGGLRKVLLYIDGKLITKPLTQVLGGFTLISDYLNHEPTVGREQNIHSLRFDLDDTQSADLTDEVTISYIIHVYGKNE